MSESNRGSSFEELYLQQKKKGEILLIAVIVLAIVAAGGLAWGFSKDGGTGNQTGPGNFQQGQGFPGGGGGPGGGPGGMRGMNVTQFFNDEVKSFLSRMPSGGNNSGFNFLDRFKDMINQAAENGDITQAQADALIQAFEAESNANET